MRMVGDLGDFINTWRISSWYCDQVEPSEAYTHNACGPVKVSSLFQLPIKLKFHFWHFNVQTPCLSLILAPIYKHSAVHVHKPNIQAMSICTTVPFIVAPIMAALSHSKPASAGTSSKRYRAQGRAKRDILYFSTKMKVR